MSAIRFVLDDQIIPHIHATLRFDEDVGDEWFTVFLIYNLTKAFDGLIARISDSDGEFLLIEAANSLPSWANPETCQMRVFVLNESIHIIPDKHKNLMDILNILCHRPNAYKLSEEVQSIIRTRISVYPKEIKERIHKAKAYLPEKAAAMFQEETGLIAPAIRMLFHSDPFERKVNITQLYDLRFLLHFKEFHRANEAQTRAKKKLKDSNFGGMIQTLVG